MPKFNDINIEQLEKFSKIKCSKEEEAILIKGIEDLLNYADQLNEVDTTDVPTCNFVLSEIQQNITRDDDNVSTMDTDLFLSNAPDQIAQMVKVPAILKN